MQKSSWWILGGIAAAVVGAKLLGLKKFNDLLSISVRLSGKPAIKGGVFGNLEVPFSVVFTNRTSNEVKIRIPAIQLFYNNSEIGNIAPQANVLLVKQYASSSFPTLKFLIPITTLVTSGIGKDMLMLPNGPSDVVKRMKVIVHSAVNGVDVKFEEKFSSESVSGLGLTARTERRVRSKADYQHLIAPLGSLDRTDPIVNPNGNVDETLYLMKDIVSRTKADTRKLAAHLKGSSLEGTCRNIFNFVYTYIQYEPDSAFAEQLRRPLRTLHDQKGDCDCYSILIGSILANLGIPFVWRVTAYNNKPNFQHVYVIVPTSKGYITVDPVLDNFNEEKPFSKNKDFQFFNR